MSIKILLANGAVAVRHFERKVLQKESDIEIVGEAANEPNALRLVKSLEPQIVVTDFASNRFGKRLKSQFPPTKVLVGAELRRGTYIKNFVKIFGTDGLVDSAHTAHQVLFRMLLAPLGADVRYPLEAI